MSDLSVTDASNEVLINELISRGILNIAKRLETYIPNDKELVLANGIAYNIDDSRKLLAELLAQQYAYQRIALGNDDFYESDEIEYERIRGEGTD